MTGKHPGGRPTKYDPSMCTRVIELGKQGYSRAEIAADLDVIRETVTEWTKVHPEFSAAIQRASELSLAWWEQQARSNLTTPSFQAALWKQAMSGRFPAEPYRERAEVAGPNGGPIESKRTIDLSGLTEDQLAALANIKLPADV